jgi:S-layer protein (TIGR01567 family)
MTVTLDSETSKTISEGNLTYTTTIMDANYASENLELLAPVDFQLIGYFGDEYVPIIKYRSNKLSKLVMDDNEPHIIRIDQALELGEGYAVTAKQIDVNGEKVWLELTKNGEFVTDKVIEVASPATSANILVYDQDIAGESDVVTLKIFVKQVLQGLEDSIVVIDGIWQISDSVMEVKSGDEVGKLEVTSVGGASITMKNEEPITLASGSTQEIANGLSFRVADDNYLRFCLMKSFTEPGIYELRGSIAEDEVFKWTPAKFQGFYYDIDNDIGTESLEILNLNNRIISKNNLTYSTTVQEMNCMGKF